MGSEIVQFAVALAALAVVISLWLYIIYIPKRTMERGSGRDRDDA